MTALPFIPPPPDLDDFDIDVEGDDNAEPEGLGEICRGRFQLGSLCTDLVIAGDPRWIAWAVGEALRGRTPATQTYLSPVLTGGPDFDLGHGPVARPMIFGGDTCRPVRDGCMCDEVNPLALPHHDALAPAPRPRVRAEDAGDVVFDDFESMDWPSWRMAGGTGAA